MSLLTTEGWTCWSPPSQSTRWCYESPSAVGSDQHKAVPDLLTSDKFALKSYREGHWICHVLINVFLPLLRLAVLFPSSVGLCCSLSLPYLSAFHFLLSFSGDYRKFWLFSLEVLQQPATQTGFHLSLSRSSFHISLVWPPWVTQEWMEKLVLNITKPVDRCPFSDSEIVTNC